MTVKVGFYGPDRKQNCWFSHAKAQSISLYNIQKKNSGVKIEKKKKNSRKKKIFIIYAKTSMFWIKYKKNSQQRM